jgi:alpha,alpha-trehalase
MAECLSSRWLKTVHDGFQREGVMFEKYDVVTGSSGHGGEYSVQAGFGWTNGVALSLLDEYGLQL